MNKDIIPGEDNNTPDEALDASDRAMKSLMKRHGAQSKEDLFDILSQQMDVIPPTHSGFTLPEKDPYTTTTPESVALTSTTTVEMAYPDSYTTTTTTESDRPTTTTVTVPPTTLPPITTPTGTVPGHTN